MKYIINEKLYDTSTSEVILEDGNVSYYITKNNSFFKVTETGATTIPELEIKQLLGQKKAEKYIEIFGEVQEG